MPLVRKIQSLFAVLLAFFAMLLFLSPGTSLAARLAGDEQPVSTTPAPAPTVAGQKAASSPMPVAPRAVPPAIPGGAAGVPQAVTGSPAGSIPAQGVGRRSPSPLPAGSAATPSSSVPPPTGPVTPPPVATAAGPKQPEKSPASSPAASPQSGRYVTIDFDNVDITVFIKFVSELTGKNFVIDDKVKGKVTVISPKKIAVEDVYKVFESVLDIYGFAAVQAGDVIKVIQALEARGKNLELRLKKEDIAPEDKIVTQIYSLQHATPDDMKKVLDPLISKTSVIIAYPPTGMLS